MSAALKLETTGMGVAVVELRPANQHRLTLKLNGRMERVLSREVVAELKAALDATDPAHARLLIATFLPGFAFGEYRALCAAVDAFERLARIEAERENPRHWPSTERVPL